MKQAFKLIFLITYTVAIFLIKNPLILAGVFLFNLAFIVVLKTNVKQMLGTMLRISVFILITFVINILLTDIKTAVMVFLKIILSFSFVYSYRKIISPMQLATAVETIFKPLKLFRVKTSDISLIVNMSVTFVPILAREFEQIMTSLKSRCIQVYGITKTHKKLQYMFMPWLYNIFERTNSLELALKSRGYTE